MATAPRRPSATPEGSTCVFIVTNPGRPAESLRDQIVSLTVQSGVLYVRAWRCCGSVRAPHFACNWAAHATVLTALQLLLA